MVQISICLQEKVLGDIFDCFVKIRSDCLSQCAISQNFSWICLVQIWPVSSVFLF
jgi:hypothetical protein